jgi:hypothetical protein
LKGAPKITFNKMTAVVIGFHSFTYKVVFPKSANILPQVIDSDDSASYVELKDIAKEHNPQVITKEKVGKILP